MTLLLYLSDWRCTLTNTYRIMPDEKTCEVFFNDGSSFLIDAEDLDRISVMSWSKGKRGYPISHLSRKSKTGKRAVCLHRVLIQCPPNYDIDHISGDKMDNRKSNLRVCTHQQNMFNQKMRCTNSSGYYGVSFHKGARKWCAYIHIGGKKLHLGLFEDKQGAAEARDRAAELYFGEYARLNRDLRCD